MGIPHFFPSPSPSCLGTPPPLLVLAPPLKVANLRGDPQLELGGVVDFQFFEISKNTQIWVSPFAVLVKTKKVNSPPPLV